MVWSKPRSRGLSRGERSLAEVECRIVDSSGTSLPGPGAAVVVGVTDDRLLVWAVPRLPMLSGPLLGHISRARVLGAQIERHGARTAVRFRFDAEASLVVDARRERHPEQLAWALSADLGHDEQ